jgi:hypothetical protein
MAQGKEGDKTPIKNKTRMNNTSQCGSTQGSSRTERTTSETTKQVCPEEKQIETEEVSMEEG